MISFFYSPARREWRWRLKAKNGRIVAASSEGFKTRAGCVRNLRLTALMLADWLTP